VYCIGTRQRAAAARCEAHGGPHAGFQLQLGLRSPAVLCAAADEASSSTVGLPTHLCAAPLLHLHRLKTTVLTASWFSAYSC